MNHAPLACTLRGCEFDIRHDPELMLFSADYLRRVAADIQAGRVRHFSLSVHPAEAPFIGGVIRKQEAPMAGEFGVTCA